MKRLLASLLTMVALTACASPFAKAETPQQALSSAAQRATQLKSAKFDFSGHVIMTFPPALRSMFGQSGNAGTFSVDLTGNGEAQFPDRYQATINAKMSGLSIATEVIVANGKAYVKNPLTNKWEASTQSQGITGQFGQPDPLSYDQLLKNVKSIDPKNDDSIDGTAVHHYQLTPDKDKLMASLEKSSPKNPQAAAALKQVLDSGTMTIDVWFGKDDHLVRRLSTNADYVIDLNQLMSSLGAPAASTHGQLPAGSTIHATAQIVINYHDFDKPVTISVPTVG
ncbi:MAG TPA: hypothetical protein VE951_00540 [Candidatus Angelobacter sp.]|nr:hypothetical protein [Candidatus Angelobacter sp.]